MNPKDFDVKLGEAWKSHNDGQHAQAVELFQELVNEYPDHIDANWGLGLSYRKAGDKANAVRVFQKVSELITLALDTHPEERERYFMLKRMVTQQIEQVNDFLG
jgi:Flp pilus assembly protein TadD